MWWIVMSSFRSKITPFSDSAVDETEPFFVTVFSRKRA